MRTIRRIALALFVALPLMAQTPYSITPSAGSTAGGTVVTIKGDFGTWPYLVFFGSEWVNATRVDEHTLVATTPAHLPDTVKVTIFEYDLSFETGLTFTFFGGAPPAFERVLLPIFTPPVHGAFGSEFHTDLRIAIRGTGTVSFYGLHWPCPFPECDELPADEPYQVRAGQTAGPDDVKTTGNPGQFLWVKKDSGAVLSMNLRVHDVTRDALNFGTEIPIVSDSEWVNDRIVFSGVPRDPRFRLTLRIYGQFPFTALVKVGDREPVRVPLSENGGLFDVPYAAFSDFPSTPFLERVTIEAEQNLILPIAPIEVPMWAMITVTNNETQAISTITPQP